MGSSSFHRARARCAADVVIPVFYARPPSLVPVCSVTPRGRRGRVETSAGAAVERTTPPAGGPGGGVVLGGQGRGRTADLPLFRRTLVPTELPARARRNLTGARLESRKRH